MEILLIIGGIWLIIIIFSNFLRKKQNQNDSSTYTPNSTPTNRLNTQTFRPNPSARKNSNINFKTTITTNKTGKAPATADLEGLHDAFTGAPLDKSLGLHQCQSCKVFYHTESLLVLREANASKCVGCQSTNIIAVIGARKTAGGKDYTPGIVTLNNYKQHEGSVVTFEGQVYKVNESRRGNDFAVMFENKSWKNGFKLVFFRGAVREVGGAKYINGLANKKVKVRGLIVKHPRWGYEIIVSEKSMILAVK